jgi:hypothetical protein
MNTLKVSIEQKIQAAETRIFKVVFPNTYLTRKFKGLLYFSL